MDWDGRGNGEELGGVAGWENIIKKYYLRKKIYFQQKGKILKRKIEKMIQQFHYESGIHTCVQEMRLATYICTAITLCVIAKIWNQPKYPQIYKPTKKTWYVKAKQYFSVFKRIQPFDILFIKNNMLWIVSK